MANTVQIRFRDYLPGAGFDSSGAARQGKVEVRGQITVSSYTKGGESLTPADLSLNTIDYLDLRVVNPVKSPDPVQDLRTAHYSDDAQEFYIISGTGAGDFIELTGATAVNLQFNAFGDTAEEPELL